MARGQSKSTIFLVAVGAALAGLGSGAQSAPPPSTSLPAKVEPSEVVGPLQPQALLSLLRQGGLVLWMRHGERDDKSGDVTDAQAAAHDCAQQSLLTQTGMAQARAVGAGMHSLGVPIAAVHAARLCRTEATAELLGVGPASGDDRLDEATTWTDRGGDAAYQKAVLAILSTSPPEGQNVVEVTSQLTIADPQPGVLATMGLGEVAVIKPHPNGSPELLARIGRDAWPTLLRQVDQGSAGTEPAKP